MDLALHVAYSYEGERWRAEVIVLDSRGRELGRRRLVQEAESCLALLEPLTVVLTLLADTTVEQAQRGDLPGLTPPSDPPEAEAATDSNADEEPTQTLQSESPSSPSPSSSPFWAGLSLVGTLGQLPEPAFGLAVEAGALLGDDWTLGLEGRALWPQTTPVETSMVHFSSRSLALRACFQGLERAPWRWSLCGVQRLLLLSGRGENFLENRTQARFNYNVGAELVTHLALARHLELLFALGAERPLVVDTFVATDASGRSNPLFEPAQVVGIARIGAIYRF